MSLAVSPEIFVAVSAATCVAEKLLSWAGAKVPICALVMAAICVGDKDEVCALESAPTAALVNPVIAVLAIEAIWSFDSAFMSLEVKLATLEALRAEICDLENLLNCVGESALISAADMAATCVPESTLICDEESPATCVVERLAMVLAVKP